MERQDWENLFTNAMSALRRSGIVPIDTGNLAFNSIKGIWIGQNRFKIYIDENVAPYAKYTIEPWEEGQNPNQGWFERAVVFVAEYIENELGGTISD